MRSPLPRRLGRVMEKLRATKFLWFLSGFSARLMFFPSALIQFRRARKLFPNVRLRPHFVEDEWGISKPLCLTDSIQVPMSFLALEGKWQSREIEAFMQGEPKISNFFAELRAALPDRGQNYEYQRRIRTPRLLDANPKEFVILIQISSTFSVQIRDGVHRAVVAELRGLDTITAKLIGPYTPSFGWEWFFFPFYTTLRRRIAHRAIQRRSPKIQSVARSGGQN